MDNQKPLPYPTTLRQAIENNRAAGQYFFEPDTMRFFRSRIDCRMRDGRMFVTSERGPRMPRRFTIRRAELDGSIETVGDFQQFATKAQALAEIKRIYRAEIAAAKQASINAMISTENSAC